MPNHYHLLLRIRRDGFSTAMQSFGQSYTNAINKRHRQVGLLFQGSFQAIRVDEDAYLVYLSRYIHLNPVAAHLADEPAAWEFSSYHEYAGLRAGSLPQPEIVLAQFRSREAYIEFVCADMANQDETIGHLLFDEG